MNSYIWLLFLISFLIFFRTDVANLFGRFDKHPYILFALLLFFWNQAVLLNLEHIEKFFIIFAHLIQKLFQGFVVILTYLDLEQPEKWSKYIVKVLILAFLLFFPVYYQKKHASSVFLSERISINVIYFSITVFYCFFYTHYHF
jgi:hypothetical protein